jgi:hypothetical protein
MPIPDHLKAFAQNCKLCGKLLVFAVNQETGARVPLDTIAPTFTVETNGEASLIATRSPAFVTHFATCPAANEFGRKAKAKGAGR